MAVGSIYYDKTKKKWRCLYYVINKDTLEEVRKSKSFPSEKDDQDFLTSIQCHKGK